MKTSVQSSYLGKCITCHADRITDLCSVCSDIPFREESEQRAACRLNMLADIEDSSTCRVCCCFRTPGFLFSWQRGSAHMKPSWRRCESLRLSRVHLWRSRGQNMQNVSVFILEDLVMIVFFTFYLCKGSSKHMKWSRRTDPPPHHPCSHSHSSPHRQLFYPQRKSTDLWGKLTYR